MRKLRLQLNAVARRVTPWTEAPTPVAQLPLTGYTDTPDPERIDWWSIELASVD